MKALVFLSNSTVGVIKERQTGLWAGVSQAKAAETSLPIFEERANFLGPYAPNWTKSCAMLFTVFWGGTLRMSVENIVEQIDKEIADLTRARALLAGLSGSSTRAKLSVMPGKRVISASARRRMAAAQKARWAKYRANKKAS
jgi:hypothetical protein